MNKKYKNYLDHEIKVKFADGVLAKNQEWQWFIDYVEENYDMSDIQSYSDFQSRSSSFIRLLGNITRILEVCNKDWSFETLVFSDIFYISRYSIGAMDNLKCQESIVSQLGKLLFVSVWLTKLENSDNGTNYLVDMNFFNQRNFHQSIKMQSLINEKDYIKEYLDQISIEGFDIAKQCLMDNLNTIFYDVTEGFFEKYEDKLLTPNVFSYQIVEREPNLTWQEHTLLDMLEISIEKDQISPMFSGGGALVPDYTAWTHDLLIQIKEYFNNPISDFVIESIDFVKNKTKPNQRTIETHCRILTELLDTGENFEILSSSTFKIVSLLFSEGIISSVEKTEDVLELFKTIHNIDSIDLLLELREKVPLKSNQKQKIKEFVENQYKRISTIEDVYSLNEFFGNNNIAKHINQKYYDMIGPKFLKFIQVSRQQILPELFYQAMLFLIELNQTNQNVDKRIVKQDMINLQEYWQNDIYLEQIKNLQEFTYNTQVPSEKVDNFNQIVMDNPLLLAKSCIMPSVEDMVNVMISVSNNPLIYKVKRITFTPIYPIKDLGINYEKHDTDNLLRMQVEKIVDKYGYKFRNLLDTDIYVSEIHSRYKQNVNFVIAMFNEEEKLYSRIESMLGITLIPYEEKISLAHLTQLFPLLEIQIRKLGKIFGIVPFKESASEFMKFKDPSSILRELIEGVYQELDGFESAPDLLFVYHFMYNSNSLNIRNECIHGRDYIEGYSLKLAFKVIMMALYMVVSRINLILKNMEDKN